MPKARVQDFNLNYEVRGEGDPLLMITGLGASSSSWEPKSLDELAKSFAVITFDNRGTGQSDKPDVPYSMALMADDAAGLLDYLELPRAHVLGLSMGGMIAQEFALRHPEKLQTLTLGCTSAGSYNSLQIPPEALQIMQAPREGVAPEEVIRRGWALLYTPEFIRDHHAELEASIARALENSTPPFAYQRQFEAARAHDSWDRLSQIKAPTLVLTGDRDTLQPRENSGLIVSRIPGAILHVIENAGHAFFREGRDLTLRVLVPFLKENSISG